MTMSPGFRRIFCIAAIVLSFDLAGACRAQADPPENADEEENLIYPKYKDIVIEQNAEEKKNTKAKIVADYPLGKSPYYRFESVEGDYYRITEPIPGRLKKSDCYTLKEFKTLMSNKMLLSKDNWLKFMTAQYLYDQDDEQEGIDILNTIDPEFRDNTEIRILRARLNVQLKAFESAILDVEPVVNAKAGPGNSRPANIRLIKASALMRLGKYQDVLDEVGKALDELDGAVPEWIYLYTRSHYKTGNYEKALACLDLNQFDFEFELSSYYPWLKSRCLILKERPEYDKAVERVDSEEMLKSEHGTGAALDAAFIHATRPDLAKRNGKRALLIIESLKKREDFDLLVKDATMAETLAHLETGNYEEANRCMEALKMMYVTENEFPYLKQVEKAIRLKQKYVPKGRLPLVREMFF